MASMPEQKAGARLSGAHRAAAVVLTTCSSPPLRLLTAKLLKEKTCSMNFWLPNMRSLPLEYMFDKCRGCYKNTQYHSLN